MIFIASFLTVATVATVAQSVSSPNFRYPVLIFSFICLVE